MVLSFSQPTETNGPEIEGNFIGWICLLLKLRGSDSATQLFQFNTDRQTHTHTLVRAVRAAQLCFQLHDSVSEPQRISKRCREGGRETERDGKIECVWPVT